MLPIFGSIVSDGSRAVRLVCRKYLTSETWDPESWTACPIVPLMRRIRHCAFDLTSIVGPCLPFVCQSDTPLHIILQEDIPRLPALEMVDKAFVGHDWEAFRHALTTGRMAPADVMVPLLTGQLPQLPTLPQVLSIP